MKKILLFTVLGLVLLSGSVFAECETGSGLTGEACNNGACIDRNDVCEDGVCVRHGGIARIFQHPKVVDYSVSKVSDGVYSISLRSKNMRVGRDLIMIGADKKITLRNGQAYIRDFDTVALWRTYSENIIFTVSNEDVRNADGSITVNIWERNWDSTGKVFAITLK